MTEALPLCQTNGGVFTVQGEAAHNNIIVAGKINIAYDNAAIASGIEQNIVKKHVSTLIGRELDGPAARGNKCVVDNAEVYRTLRGVDPEGAECVRAVIVQKVVLDDRIAHAIHVQSVAAVAVNDIVFNRQTGLITVSTHAQVAIEVYSRLGVVITAIVAQYGVVRTAVGEINAVARDRTDCGVPFHERISHT